jgi:ribosomal protein S18 acetylase RimI-like enzyme
MTLVDFDPAFKKELVRMWRESFEHGVAILDPHPIEEQEHYLDAIVLPNHQVKVAFLDGKMVGFVAANATAVSQLYVRTGFERRGIGTRMLEWAKAQSGGTLWLFTFAHNSVARAFYERHGFRIAALGHEPHWNLDDIRYEWSADAH